MQTKELKPAPGLQVRDPDTRQLLPPEGRTVEMTPYWVRRLRDGDVVEVPAKADRPRAGA